MAKFIITKIDHDVYYLQDEKRNTRVVNIGFYDLDTKPMLSDYIIMAEKLLKEPMLNFGSLDSQYGHDLKNISEEEIITLIINKEEIKLKRIYG